MELGQHSTFTCWILPAHSSRLLDCRESAWCWPSPSPWLLRQHFSRIGSVVLPVSHSPRVSLSFCDQAGAWSEGCNECARLRERPQPQIPAPFRSHLRLRFEAQLLCSGWCVWLSCTQNLHLCGSLKLLIHPLIRQPVRLVKVTI